MKNLLDDGIDDDRFLNYCEIHSRTDRALFAGTRVKRLADLAGTVIPGLDPETWYTLPLRNAGPLIEKARERLHMARIAARADLLARGFVEGALET